MDLYQHLLGLGLSRGKAQYIASAPKSFKHLMLNGLPKETIRRIWDNDSNAYNGTARTSKTADLRSHHLTQKRRSPKYAYDDANILAQKASKQLRKKRNQFMNLHGSTSIPPPGRTTGKENTLVRGPRTAFQPTPSRLSDEIDVNDCDLEDDDTDMIDFDHDIYIDSSDDEDVESEMGDIESTMEDPNDQDVESEMGDVDSSVEEPDDYDIEMARFFGEESKPFPQTPGLPIVDPEEPERQTKRKRESVSSEPVPGDVEHDQKRRKLEIGTGSSQVLPPGLRDNGGKEQGGNFDASNSDWRGSALQNQKGGSEEAQSLASGGSPVIMTLLPMNGTFEPRRVIVPFFPDSLRLGRQVSAETAPTAVNGYFNTPVVSRQHASVWAENETGKIWIEDLGSSNGTFVDGVRLSPKSRESEPHELRDQVTLDLGVDAVSDDPESMVHHKVAAKVELVVSDEGDFKVSEQDTAGQETSKKVFGISAELKPSPIVTIPRTARFSDSVWMRRSLMHRNGYKVKGYDKPIRPSEEFRSFFAKRRQRKALLRKGERLWNDEDVAFMRRGKEFAEPGAKLGAEFVAKSLLDGRHSPLQKLVRQSQESLDSRRRRELHGPKVKKLSQKQRRMNEQIRKSGLNGEKPSTTVGSLMSEVEEELAKWEKEEQEQANHDNALLLFNECFLAAAKAKWPSGAWSEME